MNFTQQYGKKRQRCQQNKFCYAVWQLLLYFYREFPLKILSLYILKMVVKIFRVPLDRFCFNLQGLCRKVLFSEPGELFFLIVLSLFTNNWWKMGSKFSKKFQTPAICRKNCFLAHCFDSSETINQSFFLNEEGCFA